MDDDFHYYYYYIFYVNSFLLKWRCKPVTHCTHLVTASLMQHENQALHDQINCEYNAAVTLGKTLVGDCSTTQITAALCNELEISFL